LIPREREIIEMIVDGKTNKVIAAQLGISGKTV
jgi:DNA-binding CsgD family transcriptional regulator